MGAPPWEGRNGVASVDGGRMNDIETWIRREVRVPFDGELVFDVRTDTEQNFDKLHLLIDGADRQQFSGERPWRRERQQVEEGPRDVRFVYSKDSGTTRGEDTVAVDNVWLVRAGAICPLPPLR